VGTAAATFGLVGGGFRAQFFLRIAQAMPELFRATGLVVRDPTRAQAMQSRWGAPTYPSLAALLDRPRPDFLVLSVPRGAAPALLTEAAAARLPVLTETPPAADLAGLLAIWSLVAAGARIQVAEQYPVQPQNACWIALARSGRLGDISQVQLSLAHDYHGMSLLRPLLGVSFETARIAARSVAPPIVAGPDRQGPPREERIAQPRQVIAQLEFGDKLAIHDFVDGQYRMWVRAPRLLVRGERGEIKDNELRYLKDFRTPVTLDLRRLDTGQNGSPEQYAHRGILAGDEWIYRNPFPGTGLADDEIAGAIVLAGMTEYAAGGRGPYDFAQAAQDHYLALCIEQAIATGTTITTEPQPWTPRGGAG
jgi:predicted dehydrogenase